MSKKSSLGSLFKKPTFFIKIEHKVEKIAIVTKKKVKETIYTYAILKILQGYLVKITDVLLNRYIMKRRFKKALGYSLDLQNVESFNQKVAWKKINNRSHLLPITADKYRVRGYVKQVLGDKRAEEILIPLIHHTSDPTDIPFSKLPQEFIIKANHASKWNIVVENNRYKKKDIVRRCKKWILSPFGKEKFEWAYQPIKRKVVIEKIIRNKDGNLPRDYKLFLFHGKCKAIQVDVGRHEGEHRRALLDPEWNPFEVRYQFPKAEKVNRPILLDEMIDISEALGSPFDFVRVDLYNVNQTVYFGEITHYPGSGHDKFEPTSFDFRLGKLWSVNN